MKIFFLSVLFKHTMSRVKINASYRPIYLMYFLFFNFMYLVQAHFLTIFYMYIFELPKWVTALMRCKTESPFRILEFSYISCTSLIVLNLWEFTTTWHNIWKRQIRRVWDCTRIRNLSHVLLLHLHNYSTPSYSLVKACFVIAHQNADVECVL